MANPATIVRFLGFIRNGEGIKGQGHNPFHGATFDPGRYAISLPAQTPEGKPAQLQLRDLNAAILSADP
ncbi:MAG: hypothetical protein WC080_04555 [Patescibacteria group bacterium]